jgi:hypothetical protein
MSRLIPSDRWLWAEPEEDALVPAPRPTSHPNANLNDRKPVRPAPPADPENVLDEEFVLWLRRR